MTTEYIDVSVNADANTMVQTALNNIAASLPGWQPREGNLEVLLLEQFAVMSAETAQVAAQVPQAIFTYYGNLLGISQTSGTKLQVGVTWELTGSATGVVTIAAGTSASVVIQNVIYSFTVDNDFSIDTSVTTNAKSVPMTAATAGAFYNVVSVGTYLTPTFSFSNISTVNVDSIITAGADEESTQAYLNRLKNTISVYTPRPIIANDFASLAVNASGVNRSSAINNFNPFVNVLKSTVASPTTDGWNSYAGSTITNSSSPVGVKVTSSSTFPSSFNSAATNFGGTGTTYIPFLSTTAVANAYTTLSAQISTAGATTMTVASTTGFPVSGVFDVLINSELITVTSNTGTTWSITRGVGGTTATAHANGATVQLVVAVSFPLTTANGWNASGGYGFMASSANLPIAFSYTGITGNVLTGVSFGTTGTYYQVAGKYVAYAGPSGFYASGNDPVSIGTNAGIGIGLGLRRGTPTPAIQTTLSAAITSTTATSITVSSVSGFPTAPYLIFIDSELLSVSSSSGTTLTVVRGVGGTTAATHLNAATVTVAAVEGVIIEGIKYTNNGSGGTIDGIGFQTTEFDNAYLSGATITLATGTTSDVISVSSNCVNLIGTVTVQGPATPLGAKPMLSAVVTYQNMPKKYVFFQDPIAYSDYNLPYTIAVLIPDNCPDPMPSVEVSDPVIGSNFKTNVATVQLNVYWAGQAIPGVTRDEFLLSASLNQTLSNFSFMRDQVWETSLGNGDDLTTCPGSLIPDSLFESFVPQASTTFSGSTTAVSSLTSVTVADTAGWPTSGAGYFTGSDNLVYYFTYTGVNQSTLTIGSGSFKAVGPGTGNLVNGSTVYCLNTSPLPTMWKFTSATDTAGTFSPLPGLGLLFKPALATSSSEATVRSNIFSLYGDSDYFIDYEIDLTNVTVDPVTPILPKVIIYGAQGNSFNVLKTFTPAASQVGTKCRVTDILNIAGEDYDAYVVIDFPSTLIASGSITISNLQLLPQISCVTNATVLTVPFIIDEIGMRSPGPTWTPGGVGYTGYERCVTTIVADRDGICLPVSDMQTVQTYINSYRETSFNAAVVGPSYVIIDITYSVIAAKGYDSETVTTNVLNELLNYISPYNWATTSYGSPLWDSNQTILHYLDVAGYIDDAEGVASVTGLKIGVRGTTQDVYDIDFSALGYYGTFPILGVVSPSIAFSNAAVFELSGE